MRFGCCSIMVFPNSPMAAVEALDELQRVGYDYVELSLRHLAALNKNDFASVVRILTSSGIQGEVCHNFFPEHIHLTGSEIDSRLIGEYAKSSLERAAEVGAVNVVFGSGISRQVPIGFPKEKATEQLVILLRRISDIAQKLGMRILIEPLNEEECNIVNSNSEGIELIEDVSKDNVQLVVDFYHVCKGDELRLSFPNADKHVQHVHFARPSGRSFPKRIEEDERYLPFFNELRRINYNQRISIEAYTRNFPEDARESLGFLRAAFPSR